MPAEKELLLPFIENDWAIALLGAPWKVLCAWLIAANVTAFLLFGLDKWKAQRKRRRPEVRRIRERTLLLWAALGGSVGAILGMRLFRHKTRKPKFAIGLPLILFLQVLLPLLWTFRRYWTLPPLLQRYFF